MKRLRVIFMGTPAFVVPVLEALLHSQHDVVAVYTQPPRPAGRGYDVKKSAVHERAEAAGIPVFSPKNFKNETEQQTFAAHNADLAVVAAYGLLLPKIILDAPKYGCINVHVSLLPRWRGASPIQYAIWKGDTETGVTIMKMDVGMDTGPMIVQQSVPITPTTTSAELYDSLFILGAQKVVGVLDDIENIKTTPQDDAQATHAPMFKKEDGKINWSQSAVDIDRHIRAFTPWPGTFCMANGKRMKILKAAPDSLQTKDKPGSVINRDGAIACGQNSVLRLEIVRPDGSKTMDVIAAMNGGYVKQGDILQ